MLASLTTHDSLYPSLCAYTLHLLPPPLQSVHAGQASRRVLCCLPPATLPYVSVLPCFSPQNDPEIEVGLICLMPPSLPTHTRIHILVIQTGTKAGMRPSTSFLRVAEVSACDLISLRSGSGRRLQSVLARDDEGFWWRARNSWRQAAHALF